MKGTYHSRFRVLRVSFSEVDRVRVQHRSKPAGIEKRGKFVLREIDKARAGVSARLQCFVNKYIRIPRAITHAEKALFCFITSQIVLPSRNKNEYVLLFTRQELRGPKVRFRQPAKGLSKSEQKTGSDAGLPQYEPFLCREETSQRHIQVTPSTLWVVERKRKTTHRKILVGARFWFCFYVPTTPTTFQKVFEVFVRDTKDEERF